MNKKEKALLALSLLSLTVGVAGLGFIAGNKHAETKASQSLTSNCDSFHAQTWNMSEAEEKEVEDLFCGEVE